MGFSIFGAKVSSQKYSSGSGGGSGGGGALEREIKFFSSLLTDFTDVTVGRGTPNFSAKESASEAGWLLSNLGIASSVAGIKKDCMLFSKDDVSYAFRGGSETGVGTINVRVDTGDLFKVRLDGYSGK